MKLGIHHTTKPTLNSAISMAKKAGFEAIQIFPGSPQSFFPRGNIELIQDTDFPVVVHASYVINLADPPPAAIDGAIKQVMYADAIGASHIIFHAGSTKDKPHSLGMEKMRVSIGKMLPYAKRVQILIENSAQAKPWNTMGSMGAIETLANVLTPFFPKVAICIDTAHAWAAKEPLDAIAMLGPSPWFPVIHANVPNPEVKEGSKLDRHDVILSKGAFPASKIEKFLFALKPEVAIVEAMENTWDDIKVLKGIT